MSVISKQTVGAIEYHVIDDAFPVHTAPSGTICITLSGSLFINQNGGLDWMAFIPEAYGSVYTSNRPTESFSIVSGVFYAPTNFQTWSFGHVVNMNTSGSIWLKPLISGRYLTNMSYGFYNADGNWYVLTGMPVRDHYDADASGCLSSAHLPTTSSFRPGHGHSVKIYDCYSEQNNALYPIYFVYASETTPNAIGCDNIHLTSELIEPSYPILRENWETGTGSWTFVNGNSINRWVRNTGSADTGSWSIFISNNNTTPNYVNSASIVHVYRDITFPSSSGISDIVLMIRWKNSGSSSASGSIYLAPASYTPITNSLPHDNWRLDRIDGPPYIFGIPTASGYQTFKKVLNKDLLSGKTARLVLSWANSTAATVNPPLCIDGINIEYYTKGRQTRTLFETDWSSGSFSAYGFTVANSAYDNKWVVATGSFVDYLYKSTRFSAFITNTSGTTNNYAYTHNTSNTVVSHFYKDITFPSNMINCRLLFTWRCTGERISGIDYDYGKVYLFTSSYTPIADVIPATSESIGRAGYAAIGSRFTFESIILSSGSELAGQTRRLCFTWINNTTGGGALPICFDNIKIVYDTYI